MAKKNKTKRIFVVRFYKDYEHPENQDYKKKSPGEGYAMRINEYAREMGKNLVAEFGCEDYFRYHIPPDYDAYLLHLANVSDIELLYLRKIRQDAWIYGIGANGGDKSTTLEEMKEFGLDRLEKSFSEYFFREIIAQITSGPRR